MRQVYKLVAFSNITETLVLCTDTITSGLLGASPLGELHARFVLWILGCLWSSILYSTRWWNHYVGRYLAVLEWLHTHTFRALLGGHAVLSWLLFASFSFVAWIKTTLIILDQWVITGHPVWGLISAVELIWDVTNIMTLLGLAKGLNFKLILLWREWVLSSSKVFATCVLVESLRYHEWLTFSAVGKIGQWWVIAEV